MKVFWLKVWEQIKVLLFKWTAKGLRESADRLDELSKRK